MKVAALCLVGLLAVQGAPAQAEDFKINNGADVMVDDCKAVYVGDGDACPQCECCVKIRPSADSKFGTCRVQWDPLTMKKSGCAAILNTEKEPHRFRMPCRSAAQNKNECEELQLCPITDYYPYLLDVGANDYTVKEGDTMSEIAEKHGMELTKLEELNAATITNPSAIAPGQVLKLH